MILWWCISPALLRRLGFFLFLPTRQWPMDTSPLIFLYFSTLWPTQINTRICRCVHCSYLNYFWTITKCLSNLVLLQDSYKVQIDLAVLPSQRLCSILYQTIFIIEFINNIIKFDEKWTKLLSILKRILYLGNSLFQLKVSYWVSFRVQDHSYIHLFRVTSFY